MKKIYIASLIISFTIVAPIYAQTPATNVVPTEVETTPDRNRENIQTETQNRLESVRATGTARKDEIKEQVEERREEVKEKMIVKREERVRNLFSLLTRRFQAAVERLKKLGERINNRLTKLSESGNDVSSYQQQLSSASTLLSQVEQKISGLNSILESALANSDPKSAFDTSLKAEIDSIKEDLKSVHQTYVQIITQIKGLRAPIKTTPPVTAVPTTVITQTPTGV